MKKIAVIADIHGNLIALEQVVADIERRCVDLVINLGDHISGPLWPKETLDYLKTKDWLQIRGNHERQLLTQTPEKMGASDQYTW
jgi:predicted phosphodiesterase